MLIKFKRVRKIRNRRRKKRLDLRFCPWNISRAQVNTARRKLGYKDTISNWNYQIFRKDIQRVDFRATNSEPSSKSHSSGTKEEIVKEEEEEDERQLLQDKLKNLKTGYDSRQKYEASVRINLEAAKLLKNFRNNYVLNISEKFKNISALKHAEILELLLKSPTLFFRSCIRYLTNRQFIELHQMFMQSKLISNAFRHFWKLENPTVKSKISDILIAVFTKDEIRRKKCIKTENSKKLCCAQPKSKEDHVHVNKASVPVSSRTLRSAKSKSASIEDPKNLVTQEPVGDFCSEQNKASVPVSSRTLRSAKSKSASVS
ncbi:uncharacterized protein LOC122498872 [Leptopilina heterotoma]|uniref:uncharacterized protein LOC122498872 n=1 Tax=Leptopilina heterotoma TaxID=63436 RepID=UPI001CA83F0A|nr:uncharacterized protein LOC122498872 [Leptopilina heterotoma]